MCHSSSVSVRRKTFRLNENRKLCGVEAPPYFTFSRQCAFDFSHLSMRADVHIATVLLRYDLEKSNIPPTHPILASTSIQGSSGIRRRLGNGKIGKLPVPRISRCCLSLFHRSRPSVIKYLLTFVPASCFICQTVERHGNCSLRHVEGLLR